MTQWLRNPDRLPRHDAMSLTKQGGSRLAWVCFLFIFETNIFISHSRNRIFLELLDAFISNFGRIYLGHCDFNSSPITLLTFCFFYIHRIYCSKIVYILSIISKYWENGGLRALDYRVKIFCLYVESLFCSCLFDAPPQGHQPSNKCGRKLDGNSLSKVRRMPTRCWRSFRT